MFNQLSRICEVVNKLILFSLSFYYFVSAQHLLLLVRNILLAMDKK